MGAFGYVYNNVYNVQSIFTTYADTTTTAFQSQFDPSFFSKPTTALPTENLYVKFPTNLSKSMVINSNVSPCNYNSTGSYSMTLNFTVGNLDANDYNRLQTQVTNDINSQVKDFKDETQTSSGRASDYSPGDAAVTTMQGMQLPKLLETYNKYLETFHSSIGKWMFDKYCESFKSKIETDYSSTKDNAINDKNKIKNELYRIAYNNINLYPSQVFDAARTAAKKTMQEMFLYYGKSNDFKRLTHLLAAFTSRITMKEDTVLKDTNNNEYEADDNPRTKRGLYMLFAGLMNANLVIETTYKPPDSSAEAIMKLMLVELYLKSAYNLIHYDMINIMTETLRNSGDYINARMGLLAKSLFSYNVMDQLTSSMTSNNVTITKQLDSTFPTIITKFVEIMSLARLDRNGELLDTSDNIFANILKELREKSTQAQQASQSIEELRKSIKINQLTLQSLIATNSTTASRSLWMNVEVVTLMVILLFVLVGCSLLYFLDNLFSGIMVSTVVFTIMIIYSILKVFMG